MSGINLYRNFSLSMAEIYQLEEQDRRIFDSISAVAGEELEQSFAKKLIKTAAVAFVGFGIIGAVSLYTYRYFHPVEVTEYQSTETVAEIPITNQQEYVQIQVIEFEGDAAAVTENANPELTVVAEASRPDVPAQKTEETTSVETLTKPVSDQKPLPPAEPVKPVQKVPLYAVQVTGLTENEFNKLKTAAGKRNVRIVPAVTSKVSEEWTVYKPRSGSGIVLEGIEVAPVAVFLSREQAVNYAENLTDVETVVIRQEKNTLKTYNVNICCMNIEDAEKTVQETGITDKTFGFVKQ